MRAQLSFSRNDFASHCRMASCAGAQALRLLPHASVAGPRRSQGARAVCAGALPARSSLGSAPRLASRRAHAAVRRGALQVVNVAVPPAVSGVDENLEVLFLSLPACPASSASWAARPLRSSRAAACLTWSVHFHRSRASQVTLDAKSDPTFTVLTIRATNRPGVLNSITATLKDLVLSVSKAVVDLDGSVVAGEDRLLNTWERAPLRDKHSSATFSCFSTPVNADTFYFTAMDGSKVGPSRGS